MLPKTLPNFAADSLPPLVLGCAQLGMPYGVANKTGQPSFAEAFRIVRLALQNGIFFFDTAQDYGESESVLGSCFRELKAAETVRVITKFRKEGPCEIESSLQKLGVKKLYAVLIRSREFLNHWEMKYQKRARSLLSQERVQYVGASCYDEEEFAKALETDEIQVLQIPFNLLDQKALRYRWFERGLEKNKKFFVRSVFAQGALLQGVDAVTKEAALAFVWSHSFFSPLVIGVELEQQLIEIIRLFKEPLSLAW